VENQAKYMALSTRESYDSMGKQDLSTHRTRQLFANSKNEKFLCKKEERWMKKCSRLQAHEKNTPIMHQKRWAQFDPVFTHNGASARPKRSSSPKHTLRLKRS
jgi:hypothetical protein